jgi:hypothetical protein
VTKSLYRTALPYFILNDLSQSAIGKLPRGR